MTSNFSEIKARAVSLPITTEIRSIAREFAARQPSSEKAERVRLNTIAVSVVNNYLTMLGIETDLAASDSWNPIMQLCGDSADLVIAEVGRLECRPIKSNVSSCQIPLEVWDLRIGYTVVEIEDSSKTAKILGFIPQVTTEELSLSALQPPETLIDRIAELKTKTSNIDSVSSDLVNLNNWFNDFFDAGWQVAENIFNPKKLTLALGFRGSQVLDSELSSMALAKEVTGAKEIDLGVRFNNRSLVLLVKLIPEAREQIGVTIQIHPQSNWLYLPETLILRILEDFDRVFMEAQARSQDNFIQLQFSGRSGERFSIEIILNETKFIEHFQI